MSKITQIEDKGATIAWSPTIADPDIIALGTKVCLNDRLILGVFRALEWKFVPGLSVENESVFSPLLTVFIYCVLRCFLCPFLAYFFIHRLCTVR